MSNSENEYIVLVQCTAAKRSGVHPARRLYDESTYFRKQRAYAEAVADAWYIQSAEYGLVHPDTSIQTYDQHAGDLEDSDGWARDIADKLQHYHPPEATVAILGGADYADPVTPELERRGYDVAEPLRGQPIGKRMASLEDMANTRLEGYA